MGHGSARHDRTAAPAAVDRREDVGVREIELRRLEADNAQLKTEAAQLKDQALRFAAE